MNDSDLIEKARHMLANCKLSGPSITLCTDVAENGFADAEFKDPDAIAEAAAQRQGIQQLCLLHGIL